MIGIVYPRDAWWTRLGAGLINVGYHVARDGFRIHVHSEAAMDRLVRAAGFERRIAPARPHLAGRALRPSGGGGRRGRGGRPARTNGGPGRPRTGDGPRLATAATVATMPQPVDSPLARSASGRVDARHAPMLSVRREPGPAPRPLSCRQCGRGTEPSRSDDLRPLRDPVRRGAQGRRRAADLPGLLHDRLRRRAPAVAGRDRPARPDRRAHRRARPPSGR